MSSYKINGACLQVRLNAMELCEAENSVKLQRRKRILQEILSTEETYQRHINLIVNVGIKFLKQQLVHCHADTIN